MVATLLLQMQQDEVFHRIAAFATILRKISTKVVK
jgi:hypothetical protein